MPPQNGNSTGGGGWLACGRCGVPLAALDFQYCRASGPGGQHVNRTDSAVQMRFQLDSGYLPLDILERLKKMAAGRISEEGVLCLESQEFRSQQQNREAVIRKFQSLLEKASRKPKIRRATKPTRASRERRLSAKKRHSEMKRLRGNPEEE